MSDDPLAEIKAYRAALYGGPLLGPQDLIDINVETLDWLIRQAGQAVRLRGLLKRLEWGGGICPACYVLPNPDRFLGARSYHDPDCWLAAELYPELYPGIKP